MSTRFRIDSIELETVAGSVEYRLSSALTVLAGPVGVGKSTLLESLKYALGGNALLAPVVRQSVAAVRVDMQVGPLRLRLRREVGPPRSGTVTVTDLTSRREVGNYGVDASSEPSLSAFLLNAMGLPPDARATARVSSTTKAGSRIVFADVFKFVYVPQAEINRDIASSLDKYLEPKRRSVFELLFRLTDEEILATRSAIAVKQGELKQAEHDARVVKDFLRDSKTDSREQARAAQRRESARAAEARERITALRDALTPTIDRETQTLRELLVNAEVELAAAQARLAQERRQQDDLTAERARLLRDLERLQRLRDAGERLAAIEFTVCPRCVQRVGDREVPVGFCRLCLQPDPVGVGEPDARLLDSYEESQLRDQIDEIESQIELVDLTIHELEDVVPHRSSLVAELTSDIERRTTERVTPRLQAYADATRQLATAEARLQDLETILRQWDRSLDLDQKASALADDVQRLRLDLRGAEAELADRKRELLEELNTEFESAVSAIRIPGVERVEIHPSNYLPVLNGQLFTSFSPAGGIRTATQIAYWLTLLTVALRRRDTLYPAALILDSPRTALNNSDELSAALYRRIVTQVDAAGDRAQIIVCDNELPNEYRRQYEQIDFSYAHPTIETVPHPGPGSVELIHEMTSEP